MMDTEGKKKSLDPKDKNNSAVWQWVLAHVSPTHDWTGHHINPKTGFTYRELIQNLAKFNLPHPV